MKSSEKMSCCTRERSQYIGWSDDWIKADILLAPGLVTSQLEPLEKAAGLHMCSKMFSENLIWLTGAERKEKKQKKQKQEFSRRGPGVWRTAKGSIRLYGYRKTFVGQKTWLIEDGQRENKSLLGSISQHCVCWDDKITPFKRSEYMCMNRIPSASGRKQCKELFSASSSLYT